MFSVNECAELFNTFASATDKNKEAMESFFFALGDFLSWTFGIFRFAEHGMNYIAVIAMCIGTVVWLRMQKKYSQKAADEGTLM